SLKDSFLAHAQEYGIENIDYLFPEARSLNTPPDFIQREMGWVQKVMSGVHHTPFSRIKSVFANITEDEARARGYIKGKLKKEEVFPLLKRTTTPTTIYKKQKLDRDDIIDITDFDVVAWLKSEMRMMLDEEIARAILIGDGRSAADEDKISELNIRPIATDADLYTIKKTVTPENGEALAKAFIKAAIKARKDYKGTGTPTLFCTEDLLADMLLLEDGIGHLLYTSESQLATTLRVASIITVPVMENQGNMLGIIVNLADYNVGADKGGAVSMFDDFDIDYNQQKYLIETRCSGALTKPYSAIVLSSNEV
ncbi:MAG: phage major capsid protein, partial [Lachnospiraceae bacterium]|nr:phage major capsid protein [Lachnospiraceae bacterium]